MHKSSSSTSSASHCPKPASPVPTEIACDIGHIEQSPEECIETPSRRDQSARLCARVDAQFQQNPGALRPCAVPIAADWHVRNPEKNHGLLSPKAVFRLIKMGWFTLEDVRCFFDPYDYVALAHYNDRSDKRRYPFVVAYRNDSMPTPSQRVRLRRQAGLATYPDDYPDRFFFGYDPMGYSDDEGEGGGEGKGGPPAPAPALPHRGPTPLVVLAETTSVSASISAVVEAEAAEPVVVEEVSKAKCRKVKGTTKTRGRAKPKALRRECSRPEV